VVEGREERGVELGRAYIGDLMDDASAKVGTPWWCGLRLGEERVIAEEKGEGKAWSGYAQRLDWKRNGESGWGS